LESVNGSGKSEQSAACATGTSFLAFCSEITVGTGDYNPKVEESQGRPNAPAQPKIARKSGPDQHGQTAESTANPVARASAASTIFRQPPVVAEFFRSSHD
jgi:hypothetical protein